MTSSAAVQGKSEPAKVEGAGYAASRTNRLSASSLLGAGRLLGARFGLFGLSSLLGMATVAVVSPDAFGTYSYLTAASLILSCVIGQGAPGLKLVHTARRRQGEAGGVLTQVDLQALSIAAAAAALFVLGCRLLPAHLFPAAVRADAGLIAFAALCQFLARLNVVWLQSAGRAGLAQLIELGVKPLLVFGSAFVVNSGGVNEGQWLVVSASVSSMALSIILVMAFQGRPPKIKIRKKLIIAAAYSAFPFYIYSVLQVGFQKSDSLVIGHFFGMSAVAHFVVALKLAEVVSLSSTAMGFWRASSVGRLVQTKDYEGLKRVLRLDRVVIFGTSVTMSSAIWFIIPHVCYLTSLNQSQLSGIFAIVIVPRVVASAFGYGDVVLGFLGRQRILVVTTGVSLIVGIGAAICLGLNGASLECAVISLSLVPLVWSISNGLIAHVTIEKLMRGGAGVRLTY